MEGGKEKSEGVEGLQAEVWAETEGEVHLGGAGYGNWWCRWILVLCAGEERSRWRMREMSVRCVGGGRRDGIRRRPDKERGMVSDG